MCTGVMDGVGVVQQFFDFSAGVGTGGFTGGARSLATGRRLGDSESAVFEWHVPLGMGVWTQSEEWTRRRVTPGASSARCLFVV
jgi:hypothetical protein